MTRTATLALGALVLATALAVGPGSAAAAPAPPASNGAAVVVKISPYGGSIDRLVARYPIVLVSTVLASRGIYLVRSKGATDQKAADKLAGQLSRASGVVYAERNVEASLDTAGYHAWPDGGRTDIGSDPAAWSGQAAAAYLQLDSVHRTVRGAGVTVAVLDTGVDASHPSLSGRLTAGYDYVDDDADTSDVASGLDSDHDGVPDGAVGHGTFVAGVVALVAPEARIMPMRVLDSDGVGNVFTIAQALTDAVAAGVKVVNLSLGTSVDVHSKVLSDAVANAVRSGVAVVAAAGNDNDGRRRYFPAGDKDVVSVGALSNADDQVAAFSNYGGWVDVAAPGQHVVGPVPGRGFATWSGTSMATPFVAGEMALLLAGNRKLTGHQAGDAIGKSAVKMPGKKIHFGRIDLVRALREARIG